MTHKIVFLGILAAANVILLVSLGLGIFEAPAGNMPAEGKLPSIEVLTDTGHRVLLSSLTGKALMAAPPLAQAVGL